MGINSFSLKKLASMVSVMCVGSRGCGFDSCRVQQHPFVNIDHEMFSMVIFSLPPIQEGHLSVSGKRMCTSTG